LSWSGSHNGEIRRAAHGLRADARGGDGGVRQELEARDMTARSLERRGAFTLVCMVLLIIVALITWLASALAEPSSSRSFYDRNGSFAGSSTTRGNATTFTDRNGRFDGTAIRNSDGTTSLYDRNGHFTGSTLNTSPRR
jgi:hypothetical protein